MIHKVKAAFFLWKKKKKQKSLSAGSPWHSKGPSHPLFDTDNPLRQKVTWDPTMDLDEVLDRANAAIDVLLQSGQRFLDEDIKHLESAINNVVIHQENINTAKVIHHIATDLILHGKQMNGALMIKIAESLQSFSEQLDHTISPQEHAVLIAHLHCLRAIIHNPSQLSKRDISSAIHNTLNTMKGDRHFHGSHDRRQRIRDSKTD